MVKPKSELFKKKIKHHFLWEYVLKLIAISVFSLIIFMLLGNSDNAVSSFIWSSIAFLCITIVAVVLLFKEKKWIWFFILAYVIKLTIGLFHYLYFIDPIYFISGVYNPLTFEYDGVFNQIIQFANDKQIHGFWFFNHYEGGVTHQEILSFISIPFMFFGDYVMTITPINTFNSLLISMNIVLLSKYHFRYSILKTNTIALLTAYFPMTLITSLLYRDIVGLALMSVGITLIILSKNTLIKLLMLLIASYLFYLQRTAYPVILILAFVINTVFTQTFKAKKSDYFYKLITVLISIVLLIMLMNYSNTEVNQNMAMSGMNVDFLSLPIKMIVGLIGPFPWSNFLMYKTFPAYAYQLQDYLQGTFNVTIIAIVLLNWKIYRNNFFNIPNVLGVILVFIGLFTSQMHSTYVAIGFVFLIPWLISHINLTNFIKRYLLVFSIFLLLNIFVVVFIGNLGISSLWK